MLAINERFIFFRGKWGSCQPAVGVPPNEEQRICDMIHNGGHRITFEKGMMAVFTPIENQNGQIIDDVIDHDGIIGLTMRDNVDNVDVVSAAAARILEFSTMYSGKDYIIYIHFGDGNVMRVACDTVFGQNLIANYINLAAPLPILSRVNYTAALIAVDQMQLYKKITNIICIYSRSIYTDICVETEGKPVPQVKNLVTLNCDKRHRARTMDTLRKLSQSRDNLYIYSYNACTGQILPRIYAPHLELLTGIILSERDVDVYLHADVASATEDDIRYDDD